ncbi:MAG: ABC transporter permease [Actinomycetota bacterium]|nr:ABC transporter permease [Actinomycetota bacterium]
MTTTVDPANTRAAASLPRKTVIQMLHLDKYSALYLWAGFMIVFGLSQDSFLSKPTFITVLNEKVVIGVLALAFLIPLAAETFDLSIGNMMAFSVVITDVLTKNTDLPPGINAVIAIIACASVGFVSGFIVVKLGVNSFIATLGMSQVLSGLCIAFSGNRALNGLLSKEYTQFGTRKLLFDLPLYFYLFLLLAAIVWYVLEHTATGRYLFAVGGNREAARLAGLNTNRITWGALVASAVVAGFAGTVHTWKSGGSYSGSVGPGFLFPAVAAVFFGASQLRGRPNVWGMMIALYTLAFGVYGLQLSLQSAQWVQSLFEGISLLIAVAFASRHLVVRARKRRASAAGVGL